MILYNLMIRLYIEYSNYDMFYKSILYVFLVGLMPDFLHRTVQVSKISSVWFSCLDKCIEQGGSRGCGGCDAVLRLVSNHHVRWDLLSCERHTLVSFSLLYKHLTHEGWRASIWWLDNELEGLNFATRQVTGSGVKPCKEICNRSSLSGNPESWARVRPGPMSQRKYIRRICLVVNTMRDKDSYEAG